MKNPSALLLVWTLFLTGFSTAQAEKDKPALGMVRTPLREFTGHVGQVRRVVFSPDGHLAATCANDKTIRIWDIATGKQLRSISGHNRRLTDIAFSPDGRFLASGSLDALVKVWEVKTGEQFYELDGHNSRVNCLAYHPDGKRILTGCCDTLLRVWNVEDEKVLLRVPNRDCVRGVCASPDGAWVATMAADGTATVWDVSTGKRHFQVQTNGVDYLDEVPGLAFTSDSQRIVVGGSDTPLSVYEIASGKQVQKVAIKLRLLALSGDDHLAAMDYSTCVRLIDLVSGKILVDLQSEHTLVNSAAFSPDGKYLLSAGNFPDLDKPQHHHGPFLWDLKAVLAQPH